MGRAGRGVAPLLPSRRCACTPSRLSSSILAQEVMRGVPDEVWSEAYQAEHNAVVQGRDNNMNKFKPGVGAM